MKALVIETTFRVFAPLPLRIRGLDCFGDAKPGEVVTVVPPQNLDSTDTQSISSMLSTPLARRCRGGAIITDRLASIKRIRDLLAGSTPRRRLSAR